jgi:hypothetical protein
LLTNCAGPEHDLAGAATNREAQDFTTEAQRGEAATERRILSRKDAKNKRILRGVRSLLLCHAEPFGKLRVNSVKHLLCAFPNSFDQKKSRFFAAEFILSAAEGLLRMTPRVMPGAES